MGTLAALTDVLERMRCDSENPYLRLLDAIRSAAQTAVDVPAGASR